MIKSLLLPLYFLLQILSLNLVLQFKFFEVDCELTTHTIYLAPQAFYVQIFLFTFYCPVILQLDGQSFEGFKFLEWDHFHV